METGKVKTMHLIPFMDTIARIVEINNVDNGKISGVLELPNETYIKANWSIKKENITSFYESFWNNTIACNMVSKNVTLLKSLKEIPLSTQLRELTGSSWNSLEWENFIEWDKEVSAFEGNIIKHIKSGRLFKIPFKESVLAMTN